MLRWAAAFRTVSAWHSSCSSPNCPTRVSGSWGFAHRQWRPRCLNEILPPQRTTWWGAFRSQQEKVGNCERRSRPRYATSPAVRESCHRSKPLPRSALQKNIRRRDQRMGSSSRLGASTACGEGREWAPDIRRCECDWRHSRHAQGVDAAGLAFFAARRRTRDVRLLGATTTCDLACRWA